MIGRTHPGIVASLLTLLVVGGLVFYLWYDQQSENLNPENKPLKVYCAAGIRLPIEAIAAEYEKEFGQRIELQTGGSNTLLTSLEQANEGDLFVPGDDSYLIRGQVHGSIKETLPIATMHVVLLVPKGNPDKITSFDDLINQNIRIAQANPDAAAIGMLTREHSPRWSELEEITETFTSNVTEAANAVKLGSVQAALVWDAITINYPEQDVVKIPELWEITGRVGIGVLTSSEIPAAALRFARYVTAPGKGLKHFQANGFPDVIPGDEWEREPELLVYSGSMLQPAIKDTIKEFEQREGVKITTVFNGCGILVSQMKQGERPDMYFSCDVSFMDQVRDKEAGYDLFLDPTVVSGNQLTIAVRKGNPKGIKSLKDLAKPGITVGVGHEQKCALGAITSETLQLSFAKQKNEFGQLMENIVVKSPTGDLLVNQLRTGSLDAAVVYRSNLNYAKDELEGIPVTGIDCAQPSQPVAIGRNTRFPHLMKRLQQELMSAPSRQRFEEVGFTWQMEK